MPSVLRTGDGSPLLSTATVGPTPVAFLEEYTPVAAAQGAPFFVVEVDAFRPADSALSSPIAWNSVPWGSLALSPISIESTITIRASDLGYRTKASDPDGVAPYPALVSEAINIDRDTALDPAQTAASWGWGAVTLANDDGRYDGIARLFNVGGRSAMVKRGAKAWDDKRGIWVDPAYAELVAVFAGLAESSFLDETTFTINLRDATYWIEGPYQQNQYGGTGGYDGTASLAGTLIPRTRGGTVSHPIRNVTPVLVDDVNLIYQFSDAAGTVQVLYEGAAQTYTADGDVSDLYSGSVASGHYRTMNAAGRFQLGSVPSHTITCDVTGEFPVAGAITDPATIARYILTEDLSLPSNLIDTASFSDAASAYAYTAGLYFQSSDHVDGATAVSRALQCFGAKLIPDRTGKLRCFVLRALAGTETPSLTVSVRNAVSIKPVALPATLDPPPYRVRVAWQHNYTVQTSDLNSTAASAQLQFAGIADTFASFVSTAIGAQYARPNDLAPFGGGLLIASEAQAVADDIGALWCARRRLYDVTLPSIIGLDVDLGDVVRIVYPMDDLRNGRLGQVVREQFRSEDATVIFRVLV